MASTWDATGRYLPALLSAAVITLALSSCRWLLAVVVGVLIASGRVYGPARCSLALTAWVEIIRGTPLLLQLFVIYFGLATVVQLPAFLAALIGLGLNYAAYESEIYRGALQAVPPDSSMRPARWASASVRRCGSCAARRRSAWRSRR